MGLPELLLYKARYLYDQGDRQNAASDTWVLDGEKITVAIEDSPAEGTYADGKITLGDEDMTMVFTREMPKGIEIAEVNTAAAAEEPAA